MEIDQELLDAYRNTIYQIELGGEVATLHLGKNSLELAETMKRKGYKTGFIVTAYNPASERISDENNEKRQLELKQYLDSRDIAYCNGRNLAPSDWPEEATFCLFDVNEKQCAEMLQLFGQNAGVTFSLSTPARLMLADGKLMDAN